MLNYTNYEDLRGQLLALRPEIVEDGVDSPKYKDFKQGTDEVISFATTYLLSNTDEELRFFGNFTMKGNRMASYSIKRAIQHQLTNRGFTFIYNPLYIIDFTVSDLASLIAKEAIHLVAKHYLLQMELADIHPWLITKLACEIEAVNILKECSIKPPKTLITLDEINKKFNASINKADAKQMATDLHILMNTNKDFAEFVKELMDPTQFMESGACEILIDDMIRHIVIETVSETRGKLPGGLAGYIETMTAPPVIKWEDQLARFIGSLPAGKKKTIMRRDKRQPNRLDLRGKLSDKEVELLIAIDTSGSMSDDVIKMCMNEIFTITKHMKASIKVLECDSEINRVYEIKKPSDYDGETFGRGGTAFAPVFEYIADNNLKNAALIYMTDGYGESKLPNMNFNIHQGTLWFLTEKKEDLSLKGDNLPARSTVLSATNK